MMEAYKAWVRENRQWLSSIESLANTLTWLLPERLTASELAPECLSTAIGLFSALNRHIAESDPQGSGAHSKGVPWPFLITLVKEVEVLGEMAAVHYRGEENKWGDVAAIEAIKAVLRLLLLSASGGRMLLDGGEASSDQSPPSTSAQASSPKRDQQQQSRPRPSSPSPSGGWGGMGGGVQGGRGGKGSKALEALSRFRAKVAHPSSNTEPTGGQQWEGSCNPGRGEALGGAPLHRDLPGWQEVTRGRLMDHEAATPLISNPLTTSERAADAVVAAPPFRTTTPPPHTPPSFAPLFLDSVVSYSKSMWGRGRARGGAELLHILRPLAYVMAVRKWGRRSWKPWVMSAAMDLTSLAIISHIQRGGGEEVGGGGGEVSAAEKEEVRRRRVLLALYLMRSPCFEMVARRPLKAAESVLQHVPLVGSLAEKATELVEGIQGYHFYTAGS